MSNFDAQRDIATGMCVCVCGGGGGVTRPNNSNWRWSKLIGQNGTNICLKLKVKVGKIWSKFEIKDGQSYEIVRNFNNF